MWVKTSAELAPYLQRLVPCIPLGKSVMLNLLQGTRLALGITINVDPSFFLLLAWIKAASYSMIRSTEEDDVDDVGELSLCKEAPMVSTIASSTKSSDTAARVADERFAMVDLEDPPRHVSCTKRPWALSFAVLNPCRWESSVSTVSCVLRSFCVSSEGSDCI